MTDTETTVSAEPSEDTPIHDSVPRPASMEDVIAAINSMGAQVDWLVQSHANILATVEAIRTQMAGMGPAGILKGLLGKGGNGGG
jgi:hypothetical protein